MLDANGRFSVGRRAAFVGSTIRDHLQKRQERVQERRQSRKEICYGKSFIFETTAVNLMLELLTCDNKRIILKYSSHGMNRKKGLGVSKTGTLVIKDSLNQVADLFISNFF